MRVISRINPLPIKQEPTALRRFALPLTKGIHQFFERGCAFDFEEDFVVAVCDFDVEVFGLGGAGFFVVVRTCVVGGAVVVVWWGWGGHLCGGWMRGVVVCCGGVVGFGVGLCDVRGFDLAIVVRFVVQQR